MNYDEFQKLVSNAEKELSHKWLAELEGAHQLIHFAKKIPQFIYDVILNHERVERNKAEKRSMKEMLDAPSEDPGIPEIKKVKRSKLS